jgi:hypothetical protein
MRVRRRRWFLIAGVVAALVALSTALVLIGRGGGPGSTRPQQPVIAESASGVVRQGCSYILHDSDRYLSISNTWKDGRFRWRPRRESHGSWSAAQQKTVDDNAAVDGHGRLVPTRWEVSSKPSRPAGPSVWDCFRAWNANTNPERQRNVATPHFSIAAVGFWAAYT